MKEIVNLKVKLAEEFSMKDLGWAKKILRMRINRERKETIENITSRVHEKDAEEFNMTDAKPMNVSLGGHFKLSTAQALTTEDEKAFMSEVPYASVVSSLIHDMVCSRLDIS